MRRATCVVLLVLGWVGSAAQADLMAYVRKPDSTYTWSRVQEEEIVGGARVAKLHLVSQTWRDIAWHHELAIVLPADPQTTSHALLIIAGGSWREGQESKPLEKEAGELKVALGVAAAAKMPVACIKQVPFQPMFDGKKEDQIIALTFKEYLQSGDPEWPLLLPMTKAAVRAMDAVQAFAKQQWKLEITGFTVCGGSKRGWTTWLTGAADPRVKAIAPMVIDVLNMGKQMKHQLAAYGRYSEEIGDYTEMKLQDQLETEMGKKLLSIVDPYSYRTRLTMPKLIMLGTNDRYWTLDALNLYYDDLVGEKYILYVPNAGHGLNDMGRVVSDAAALALKAAGKLTFPKLSWDLKEHDGGIRLVVRSDTRPMKVSAWVAPSPTRDFRDAKWTSQVLERTGEQYVYDLKRPDTGFAAVFGEATYMLEGQSLFLCTNVRIAGSAP